jgi:hypothetical protein
VEGAGLLAVDVVLVGDDDQVVGLLEALVEPGA